MTFGRGDEAPAGELVGRRSERATLLTTVDLLVTTGARAALVRGDAGIGKTALVDDVAASTSAVVVRGQCIPVGHDGLPFAAISGILRALRAQYGDTRLADGAGGLFAALGTLLPDLVAPDAEDHDQLRLFAAVSQLLASLAAERPLVVVIEDLQWADDSTLALLRFLLGDLGSAPVLLLCTQRTGESSIRRPTRNAVTEIARHGSVRTIDLGPLDATEIAHLAMAAAERPLDRARLAHIHQRSGGNAFFAQELATAPDDELSEHLRDILRAQTARLSPAAADTARMIAVIGTHADDRLIRDISPLPDEDLDQTLREAIDLGILHTEVSGYRFRHALLREAIEADILPGSRQRLHRAVADALARQPSLDAATTHARALHLLAARDWDTAFRALVTAARASTVAHAETLRMYEHLLELWDLVDGAEAMAGTRADVLEAAAQAARDAGEFERASDLLTVALAETTAAEDRFRRLVLRLHVTIDLVRPGAERDAAEAESLLPHLTDPRERAEATEQIAAYYLNTGFDGRAIAAEAVRAAAALDDPALLSQAHTTRGTMLVARGDEQTGLDELRRAGDAADPHSRAALRFHLNFSDALHHTGHFEEARKHAETGAALADDLGLGRAWGAFIVGNLSEALVSLGQWDEASVALSEGLAQTPPAIAHAHLSLLQAWLWTWTGRIDEAAALVQSFPHLLQGSMAAPQLTAQALRGDSELALLLGDHARAWRNTDLALRHRDRFGPARTLPALVAGAAAAHHLDATEPIDRLPHIRSTRVRDALTEHHSTLSRTVWEPVIEAELTDTADAWTDAIEALGDASHPAYLRPYASWRLAQHLAGSRDRAAARRAIDDGRAHAEQLGATTLVQRLAILSKKVGSTGWERTGGGPLAALSAREIEVLRLVADGRTNAEIGATLFISPKTVSVHVSNILTKLDVRTRAEATGVAHRAGLVS